MTATDRGWKNVSRSSARNASGRPLTSTGTGCGTEADRT
jgi:hypothetical protein